MQGFNQTLSMYLPYCFLQLSSLFYIKQVASWSGFDPILGGPKVNTHLLCSSYAIPADFQSGSP